MPIVDLTTISDDMAVFHDGLEVHRFDGLRPDEDHELLGRTVRTLPRPHGELLCRLGTVNDVHFGELEAGRIDDHAIGPVQRPEPGEAPFPETMNRAAVAEMSEADLAAVIVKGDLTADGTDVEFEAFERCYRPAFGDRLAVVRGNHDAYHAQTVYAGDRRIDLPGVTVALIDTTIPERTTGRITAETFAFLDDVALGADRPVMVMGHHQQWVGGNRAADYFGINPDDSDGLTELIARRPAIVAYTAGHTHRHRRRALHRADDVPSIEVGCVKDFPGTWAEYRVYEGGIMQVVHRVSSPDALRWSERCRHLYRDFGIDYETYALGRLDERCFVIALRS